MRWLSLHIRDALAISDFTEGIDYPCGGVYVQPTQSFSIQWGPRASVSAPAFIDLNGVKRKEMPV